MKNLTFIIATALAVGTVFGGSVSGTVTYSGTETGMIVVGCIDEGNTTIDLMTLPATSLSVPGEYTITADTLMNDVNYWCIALMLVDMTPASGNPAGMHSSVVTLTDGSASGVDVTLAPSANIAGTITYGGDPGDLCINIYDAYNEFSGGVAELEETFCVGVADYTLFDIPSGPKKLEAFADINGNSTLDIGELSAFYDGPFGEMVVVGGGGLSESGMDINLGTDIIETVKPQDYAISVTPNPFNPSCKIDAPSYVDIFDMNGRLINTIEGGSYWNGTDVSGEAMPAGIYFAKTSFAGVSKSAILILAK
ncbi:hypothetical protein KAH81_07145 [bacterium]|nr:hypothetical protein [bacterium]